MVLVALQAGGRNEQCKRNAVENQKWRYERVLLEYSVSLLHSLINPGNVYGALSIVVVFADISFRWITTRKTNCFCYENIFCWLEVSQKKVFVVRQNHWLCLALLSRLWPLNRVNVHKPTLAWTSCSSIKGQASFTKTVIPYLFNIVIVTTCPIVALNCVFFSKSNYFFFGILCPKNAF